MLGTLWVRCRIEGPDGFVLTNLGITITRRGVVHPRRRHVHHPVPFRDHPVHRLRPAPRASSFPLPSHLLPFPPLPLPTLLMRVGCRSETKSSQTTSTPTSTSRGSTTWKTSCPSCPACLWDSTILPERCIYRILESGTLVLVRSLPLPPHLLTLKFHMCGGGRARQRE